MLYTVYVHAKWKAGRESILYIFELQTWNKGSLCLHILINIKSVPVIFLPLFPLVFEYRVREPVGVDTALGAVVGGVGLALSSGEEI